MHSLNIFYIYYFLYCITTIHDNDHVYKLSHHPCFYDDVHKATNIGNLLGPLVGPTTN